MKNYSTTTSIGATNDFGIGRIEWTTSATPAVPLRFSGPALMSGPFSNYLTQDSLLSDHFIFL
jgi:hypothetical protein